MNFIEYLNDLFSKSKSTGSMDTTDAEAKIHEAQTEGVLPDRPELAPNDPYERLEYNALTDAEIESAASATADAERRLKQSALETELEALHAQYETDKATGTANYESVRTAIDDAYNRAVSATENDLLKRGIARSSAAANRMGELEDGRSRADVAAAAEHAASMNKLDSEIAALETKRQKAFADFDVAYTLKLTEQIQALRAERDAKTAEAVKYNNTLTEKENKEEIERERVESTLYTEALEQRKTEEKLFENQSEAAKNAQYLVVYNILRESLSKMSPADAKNAVRNNSLYSSNLNNQLYYKLYEEFGR